MSSLEGKNVTKMARPHCHHNMDTIDELADGISVSVGGGISIIGGSAEFSGDYKTVSVSISSPIPFIPKEIIIGFYGTVNGSVFIWRN